jgi:S1-C subfamily serine protease
LQKQSGLDAGSIIADALFVDAPAGNYQVKPGSPALALGFRNFPMDQFGVTRPELKAIARQPRLPGAIDDPRQGAGRDPVVRTWLTAKVRNIIGQGEMSAYGTRGENGVLILEIPADGILAKAGFRKDDVIVSANGRAVSEVGDLPDLTKSAGGKAISIEVLRSQGPLVLSVPVD